MRRNMVIIIGYVLGLTGLAAVAQTEQYRHRVQSLQTQVDSLRVQRKQAIIAFQAVIYQIEMAHGPTEAKALRQYGRTIGLTSDPYFYFGDSLSVILRQPLWLIPAKKGFS